MKASDNETVDLLMREARDKYTVHVCNECNWRKSCMGREFGDSECVNERQSISLAFGIGDGYFSGLLDRIEAAHKREVAELRGALKKAYDTLYSISCSRYGEGLTGTDDIHELVTMARKCSDELYTSENLRNAEEGETK